MARKIEVRMRPVWVGVCTDTKTGRSYVYGVFDSYDYAHEHYADRGKVPDETYRVTEETMLGREGK